MLWITTCQDIAKFLKSYSGGLFLDMAIDDMELARGYLYLKEKEDELWAIGGIKI
ncbi:hypothetical protein [Clostridium botulinum]|uniref:hypothetical protein n=1 Tax=Clostridium botulinum TaxID=1491 RepID=UPI000AD99283|nr:hypothetical protein [Clostridium botulinum]